MKKFLAVACAVVSMQTFAQKINLQVRVTEANRSTPFKVHLSTPIASKGFYQVQNQRTRTVLPAQLLDSVTVLFMTEANLDPGTYHYSLVPSGKKQADFPVRVEKKDHGLLVKVKQKPVLFYHTMEAMPPPDSPNYYRRSGFIHPLYSPSGKILTDDFPAAHVHQHAIFTAWANTTFRKTSIDFWNQQSKKGTVEHVEMLAVDEGPVAATIKILLRHKSNEFGEVLKETWTLTVYPSENPFLFDLESEQQNTTADTLFLNNYHYGGLAFRGSSQWNPDDQKNFRNKWSVLTSEGIRDSAANATGARWVDASGIVDGKMAGVTVFNHPSNFRYPQAIRVHPVMPYWAYSPVATGKFFIAPGAFYKSRFRYYVHDGAVKPGTVEQYFNEWTNSENAATTR